MFPSELQLNQPLSVGPRLHETVLHSQCHIQSACQGCTDLQCILGSFRRQTVRESRNAHHAVMPQLADRAVI